MVHAPGARPDAASGVVIGVDLNRCQSYGQCVYEAPDVFRLVHEEVLEWRYVVEGHQRPALDRAVLACPVRAITVGAAPQARPR